MWLFCTQEWHSFMWFWCKILCHSTLNSNPNFTGPFLYNSRQLRDIEGKYSPESHKEWSHQQSLCPHKTTTDSSSNLKLYVRQLLVSDTIYAKGGEERKKPQHYMWISYFISCCFSWNHRPFLHAMQPTFLSCHPSTLPCLPRPHPRSSTSFLLISSMLFLA